MGAHYVYTYAHIISDENNIILRYENTKIPKWTATEAIS